MLCCIRDRQEPLHYDTQLSAIRPYSLCYFGQADKNNQSNIFMFKIILTILLCCCLAQRSEIQQVIEYLRSDKSYADDGYLNVDVGSPNPHYIFIKSIIEAIYPELKEWLLADIKQKYGQSSNRCMYIYSYIDIFVGPDNSSSVVDIQSLSATHDVSLGRFTIYQGQRTVGIFEFPQHLSSAVRQFTPIDIHRLTPVESRSRGFLLEIVPELFDWVLVAAKAQLPDKENLCFTYKSPDGKAGDEFCVLSQIWNNHYMKLTLPDGEIVQVQGTSQGVNQQDNGGTKQSPIFGIIPPQDRLLQRQN